jgi:hypothetical protein
MCPFIQYIFHVFQYFLQIFSIRWGAFSTFRCVLSNRRGCIQYFSFLGAIEVRSYFFKLRLPDRTKRSKAMAKQKAKKSKEEIASATKTKALKARHIAFICAEINSKRLPNVHLRRGEIEKALKKHKLIIPWITIDLIIKKD